MRVNSKRITTIVIAGLLAGVVLLILAQPRARAALRLVHGFEMLETDSRVRYESGADGMARSIEKALPAAVARVEQCQAGSFERPFRVYVCASHESFSRHIGQPANDPVRGIQFIRDVWVSPKAFAFHGKDTHHETLMHELSHLHLVQKLGWWHKTKEIPTWFVEGLADWVADTGYEQIAPSEAREAIASAYTMIPDEAGHLPLPKVAPDYGLTWPMFHAQSRMFVEYLQMRNEHAFDNFVAAVLRGARFREAFPANFGAELTVVWEEFCNSVRMDPENRISAH